MNSKVDPRHGKRALPSPDHHDHEQEPQKEKNPHNFSFCSSPRGDQDLSAMVSALSHVIGTSQRGGGEEGGDPALAFSGSNTMEKEPQQLPSEENGML